MKYLISFTTTNNAIKAESVLLKNGLDIRIRSLPNQISSGCGISIIFDDLEAVMAVVASNDIVYNKIYKIDNKKFIEL